MLVGTMSSVVATTATYGDCVVDASRPWLSADFHHMYGAGSISCDTKKTLAMTVKLMVRDNVFDYWHVGAKASKSGKGVFGLSATLVERCSYHPHGSFKTVVTVSIDGNKKPAVESDIASC